MRGMALVLCGLSIVLAGVFLVLLGIAYAFGPVSGAHVNPAVTLAMVVGRKFPIKDAVGYWIVQFLGAIAGAAVGNAVERSGTTEEAQELLLQFGNGERRTIVQGKGQEQLRPGDAVIVIQTGQRFRVVRAPARAATGAPAPAATGR